jgi:hypothetical protein
VGSGNLRVAALDEPMVRTTSAKHWDIITGLPDRLLSRAVLAAAAAMKQGAHIVNSKRAVHMFEGHSIWSGDYSKPSLCKHLQQERIDQLRRCTCSSIAKICS